MAVPKRKTSRAKRNMRRSHHGLTAVNVVECPRCHSKKLAHRVCENCGYYNNREVIKMEESGKEKKEQEKEGK